MLVVFVIFVGYGVFIFIFYLIMVIREVLFWVYRVLIVKVRVVLGWFSFIR